MFTIEFCDTRERAKKGELSFVKRAIYLQRITKLS